MALPLRSLHDLPSATGVIDRRYPNGDAPVVNPSTLGINLAAFNAAAFSFLNLAPNTAYDFNYRQFLTGSSAATAVISVNAASSSLGNWVVDSAGDGISINTGPNGGSGTLFVLASNGVDPSVSFPLQNWNAIPLVQQGACKAIVGNVFWFDSLYWYSVPGYTAGNEQIAFNANIGSMLTNPLIKGVFMSLTLGTLEGAMRGDYSKGFAAVDAILAKLGTANHKMGLIFTSFSSFFNSLNTTSQSNWPQYMINNGWIQSGLVSGQQRSTLKFDIDDVWNALTDMHLAYANRYNGHPLFVGMGVFDESDLFTLFGSTTVNNATHYYQKYLALQLALKAALPNSLLYCPYNWIAPGGPAELSTMANHINTIQAAYPTGVVWGGPDPFWRQTTFQKMVAGAYQAQIGIGDIRKSLYLMSRTEETYLDRNPPTPTQLYDNGVQNNAAILSWNCETSLQWKYADQLAAIASRNGAVGVPPSLNAYTVF